MKITVLVENTESPSNADLQNEHGLSIHIKHHDHSVLFDMGTSDAFARNADLLGVGLSTIDLAVISHHHYDHGGGLSSFLGMNRDAKIYLRETPCGEIYLRALWFIRRNIGLDENLFETHPNRFEFVNESIEILPDVYLIPKVETKYPKPKGNKYLYLKKSDEWRLDDFSHELILVIKDNDGLVIFSGCSHNGMLNMIDTVNNRFGGIQIKAVIGGFHLIGFPLLNTMAGSRNDVEDIGRKVLTYPIETVYSGHCTGQRAYQVLSAVMGAQLKQLHTGLSFEIT